MYAFLKKVLKSFLPQGLLYRWDEPLRWPVYLFYKGDAYHCPICNAHLKKFINHEQEGYRLCPKCGSLDRHRKLWDYLQTAKPLKGTCLDFSPSPFIKRRLERRKDIQYFTTDYVGAFVADFKYDINQIDCADESYDTIVCYHVLEHITTDLLAMSELYRILRKGGKAIIQTPFAERLHEDPSINTEELRLRHYGQDDHVRIYDVETLKERLTLVGFVVEHLEFRNPLDNRNGYKSVENILIAQKTY